MRYVKITDFLTKKQINEARKLKKAREICEKIIKPNLAKINKKLGQENDPMYLAYACEYVFSRST